MRPKDLLERAKLIASKRGALTGVVHLYYEDAEPGECFKTVDMAHYPPGPERERLLSGAVVMTGTHEDWVLRLEKEDKEAG
jgi:hypothetical protein